MIKCSMLRLIKRIIKKAAIRSMKQSKKGGLIPMKVRLVEIVAVVVAIMVIIIIILAILLLLLHCRIAIRIEVVIVS